MLNLDDGVAYLGNSATAQSESYVDVLHPLMEAHLGSPLPRINAGLGGVGSLACTALVDFLVLRHRPSLCVIETSMADSAGATPHELVSETVCELLDRLASAGIVPVLVHLPRTDVSEVERMRCLEEYRDSARRRGVLEVDAYTDFPQLEGFRDGIHHNSTGASFVAETIFSSLSSELCSVNAFQPQTRTEIVFSETPFVERFRFTIPFSKLRVGESIEIKTPDSDPLGIMVIATSKSGVIEITDGYRKYSQQVWDLWCTKPRIQMLQLPVIFRTASQLRISMTDNSESEFDCWLRTDMREQSSLIHQGSELDLVGVVSRSSVTSFAASAWWAQT